MSIRSRRCHAVIGGQRLKQFAKNGTDWPAVSPGQVQEVRAQVRDGAAMQDDVGTCLIRPHPHRGNIERPGERRGAGQAYPFQIPLRAMIPQKIDNMLVAGKSIATSHIAAAAYRVHSFEWSSGAAAGTTAAFSLKTEIFPYQLVDNLPYREPILEELQRLLESNNNPILFPETSIFNQSWEDWK